MTELQPPPPPVDARDETVVARARPAATPRVWLLWVATLGVNEVWRRRTQFIVTNRRVIWKKGVVNREERSVPLSRIQDVTASKGLFLGYVDLSSAGGSEGVERLGPVWNRTVQRLNDAIDRQVH